MAVASADAPVNGAPTITSFRESVGNHRVYDCKKLSGIDSAMDSSIGATQLFGCEWVDGAAVYRSEMRFEGMQEGRE